MKEKVKSDEEMGTFDWGRFLTLNCQRGSEHWYSKKMEGMGKS